MFAKSLYDTQSSNVSPLRASAALRGKPIAAILRLRSVSAVAIQA